MPKRKHKDDKEERWRKKLRKYEQKLRRNYHHQSLSSDEEFMERLENSPRPSMSPRPILASVVGKCINNTPEEATTSIDPIPSAANIAQNDVPETEKLSEALPPIEAPEESSADPELLQALGVFEAESSEWGRDIFEDLAKRWAIVLRDGLKKDIKEDLLKKCNIPKNCSFIKPPILNPEVSVMLNESARNRDTRLLKKQGQLGYVLSMLGTTISDILSKSISVPDILRNLSDISNMIADSHYLETETRRTLVMPMVDKGFIDPLKNRKRDSHLFGDRLGDFIKSSCGIKKTGRLIQPSVVATRNLNYKPPQPRPQSQYRASRAQQHRGGGGKAMTLRRRPAAYSSGATRPAQPFMSNPPPSTSQRHKQPNRQKQ